MTYTELSTKDNPILVLNGVEHLLQVLIATNKKISFILEIEAPRKGMEILPMAIEMAFRSLNIRAKHLKGIVCVRGPGYFTSLRVVLSIVSGIFCASQIPVATLDYLPLIAKGPPQDLLLELKTDSLWVITYARKNMVYTQGFDIINRNALTEPLYLRLDEACDLITGYKKPALVGSGVRIFADFWQEKTPSAFPLPLEFDNPIIKILWKEAINATFELKQPYPLYLRPSDAEQNLESIKAQRGLSNGPLS